MFYNIDNICKWTKGEEREFFCKFVNIFGRRCLICFTDLKSF